MKKYCLSDYFKKVFIITLITAVILMFTGCPDPNTDGGSNEPQYSITVMLCWDYQPEQSSGGSAPENTPPEMPGMISTKTFFYEDMPSKSAFISQATLNSYTAKLADYGLTQATGISGWYYDENCTIPVTEGDLQENYKASNSNYHSYTIYTKVNENVEKLISYYTITDSKDRYEYSMMGGGNGFEILMPKSPTTEDMTKILKKYYSKADLASVKIWKKYNSETHQQEYDPWTSGTSVQGKNFVIKTSQSFDDLGIYFVNVEYQTGIVDNLLYTSIRIPKSGKKVSKLLDEQTFNELAKDRCVFEIYKGEDENGDDIYEKIEEDTEIKPYDQVCIYFGLMKIGFGVKNGEKNFTIPYTGSSPFRLPATALYEGEGINQIKYATLVQDDIDKIWAKTAEYGFTKNGEKVYTYNSRTQTFSEFTPGTSKWSKSELEASFGEVYIYFDVTDDCSEDKLFTKFFLVDSEGKVGNEIRNNQFFFHKIITAAEFEQKNQLLNGMSFDIMTTTVEGVYEDKECTKAVKAGTTQVWGKTLYAKISKRFEEANHYVYKIHCDNIDIEKVQYLVSTSPTVDLSDINNFFTAFPDLKVTYFPNVNDYYKVWAYTKPLTEEGYEATAVTTLEPFTKEYYIKVANKMDGRKYVSTTATYNEEDLPKGDVTFEFSSNLFISFSGGTYTASYYFIDDKNIGTTFENSNSSISMTLSDNEKTITITSGGFVEEETFYQFEATLVLEE